jgi:hypothetical protein
MHNAAATAVNGFLIFAITSSLVVDPSARQDRAGER